MDMLTVFGWILVKTAAVLLLFAVIEVVVETRAK